MANLGIYLKAPGAKGSGGPQLSRMVIIIIIIIIIIIML
jgi:hypothetical protein